MSLWPTVLEVQRTAQGNRKDEEKKNLDTISYKIFHIEVTTMRNDVQHWPLDPPLSKQGL